MRWRPLARICSNDKGSGLRFAFLAVALLLCATAPYTFGQIPGQGRLEGLDAESRQSVVALKGAILTSDIDRILLRLNK